MGQKKDPSQQLREQGYNYANQLRGQYDILSGRSAGMNYQPTSVATSQPKPNVPSGIPGISNTIPSTGAPRIVSPQVEQILRQKFPQQYSGFSPSSAAPTGGNSSTQFSGDPVQFVRDFQSRTPFSGVQSYNELLQALDQAGVPYQRPYRGRGMSGPMSDDKLVINGRMYDVGADNGWQLADIGSAEEHGYGPGGDGVYRGPSGGGGGSNSGGYVGGLMNTMGGFNDFIKTGGFSPQDIQNIRARANAPIKAMYQLGQDEMNRAKNLSGGYMPNFAPAMAKMAREKSYAMSDASLNTEAMLSEAIRSGRLSGLSGMSSLGLGLGGQEIDLARAMMGAQNPNQGDGFSWRDAAGLGLMGLSLFSDKNMKEDVSPVKSDTILKKLKKLPIHEWRYKKEHGLGTEKHIGPMAQDFRKVFGKGDGKTISLIDAIGINLAANKAIAEKLG